jgi:hypothetical protein
MKVKPKNAKAPRNNRKEKISRTEQKIGRVSE